ncbi:MAG: hypothetical protein EBR15_09655, partial [Gammaproteobacteria bacterium]|nr:hypothetical protein [Gammaproteobacteria bacterium]
MSSGERLQKALAAAGLGSRRTIEDWIREGRVTVNGKVAELGQRVESADRIEVDGRMISLQATLAPAAVAVLGYHKP